VSRGNPAGFHEANDQDDRPVRPPDGRADSDRMGKQLVTSESPSTAPEAPTPTPAPEPASSAKQKRPPRSEQQLRRILRLLIIAFVVLLAIFAGVYYMGHRVESAPSIPDQSITKAEAAVKESPNDISARLQLAAVYARFERPDDALTQFNEILTAQPKNRAALLGVGAMLAKKGDYAAAKEQYTKFIKSSGKAEFSAADPQLEQAYYSLGIANLSLNDVPGATKALQSALGIDKTDADAWFSLGEAQSRAGKYKDAADSYSEALAFVPAGWCDPFTGLENAYTKLGDTDGVTFAKGMKSICEGSGSDGTEALSSLTKGKYQLPALLGLGLAAENDGNSAMAIEYYTKATQVDPSNITARTALARLGAPSASAAPSPAGSGS
jgi:tetratricopeptide (TPR) repeat protein